MRIKERDELKILVLQIREDQATIQEEFYSFVQLSGLLEKQFSLLNTYETPEFTSASIQGHDALFVGGSSDASVLHPKQYPFIENCQQLIRHCYLNNIPVFASCFGFQLAVQEFGGTIISDEENMEIGMYPLELSQQAKKDPLLYDTPSPFWVVSGHKERAATLPEQCDLLAFSKRCPYHIIKFRDKPFYGLQAHPEMNATDLIARITRYHERYLSGRNELQDVIDKAVHDTTYANQLLAKFVDRIILNR